MAVLDAGRADRGGGGGDRGNGPGHGELLWVSAEDVPGCGGTGSVACTWTRVWWTAGLMMSSTGLGYTPSTTTSAISGPTAHNSRALRSGMSLTSSRTGPVIVRWYIHRM